MYGLPEEEIKDTNRRNTGYEMIYHPRRRLKKYQKLRDTLNKSLHDLFLNIIFVPFLSDHNIPPNIFEFISTLSKKMLSL